MTSKAGKINLPKFDGPSALIIMDGCGVREEEAYNCVALAQTPFLDCLSHGICALTRDPRSRNIFEETSYTELIAVGPQVGMPEGAKGSTAVGHEVLSGVDYSHPMHQINSAIHDGVLVNPLIDEAIDYAVANNSAIHLLGLVSNNQEHSHIVHLYAILRRIVQRGGHKIRIHYFSDGRGTPPFSAPRFLEDLNDMFLMISTGEELTKERTVDFKIATIGGRDITMNRSAESWYKTEATFRAIIEGLGPRMDRPEAALKEAYDKGLTDQYVTPTVLGDYQGVENHDVLIHWNFRKDRGEFLMRMLVDPVIDLTERLKDSPDDTYKELKRFERWKNKPDLYYDTLHIVGLVEYYRGMNCPVAFLEPVQDISLGKVLSLYGCHQWRVSGVDKAKALTLLSGNKVGAPLSGEERITIPLPPDLRSYIKEYDQHKGEQGFKLEPYRKYPKIEIEDLTDKVVEIIEAGDSKTLVLVNLCNPDMVGHTGDVSAGIQAMMAVDKALERIVISVRARGGFALITADHGNIEEMITEDGELNTFHTSNKVPFFMVGPPKMKLRQGGTLKDVAPTFLALLLGREIEEVKKGMKGKPLFLNGG
jgi:2,3-bisphosphoglycerate-independent phosphoglycerate mutase